MKDVKASLICTTKNEESSIKEFLESLSSQSRLPDEIVIVDGGSIDRTVEIMDSYIKNGLPIRLIVEDGANIAQGRNIAITNSNYDIIASTDAGCLADRDWLKNLIKPFEEDSSVDVVSGVYVSFGETIFEKCVAELTGGNTSSWTAEGFLPSSRSAAFKKTAWGKVGGYPEYLDYAEDTAFDLSLKKVGYNFTMAKDAMVYWRMRGNLRSLFKQYYNYAKWDAVAGLPSPGRKCLSVIYCILAIILVLSAFYDLWYPVILVTGYLVYCFARYGLTSFIKLKKARCLYYGPAVALTLLLANISGLLAGRTKK